MWLICGLGNIGAKYQNTRHNVGFMVAEQLARSLGVNFETNNKCKGILAKTSLHGVPIIILQPSTYMNLSGESVLATMHYYKIPIDKLIVIHDELDLPTGAVKVKLDGGSAGHNGIKSITSCLGSNKYIRIRIGIGRPEDQTPIADYVLQQFKKEETKVISPVIENIASNLFKLMQGDVTSFLQPFR